MEEISGTDYSFHPSLRNDLQSLADRVKVMRTSGPLTPEVMHRVTKFFRIKNIYHSNAIEGNQLGLGETRQVVEQGLTLTGIPLKDQAEARNLSAAIDFLEDLVKGSSTPITGHDLRQIHSLVLKGIADHAGAYRTVPVTIAGSEYDPPGPESVSSKMDDLSRWLEKISVPATSDLASVSGLLVAAVAHTWLVTIHPFVDGNGRVARLLANLLLMRYQYPIAIISKEDRHRYYDALEESQASDLTPFLVLFYECVGESLDEYERAAVEQRKQMGWSQTQQQKFAEPERVRAKNEYEVWKNAMELFRSFLRQVAGEISSEFSQVRVKDFGLPEFEKYALMRGGTVPRKTWFCGLHFRRANRNVRYMFYFGSATKRARDKGCPVTLHVSRQEPSSPTTYTHLALITAPNVPDLREIGYDMKKEQFVFFGQRGTRSGRIEPLGRSFFDEVLKKHFSN